MKTTTTADAARGSMLNCSQCGSPVPIERTALGLFSCVTCARLRPTPKYRGAVIYGHKTAGAVTIMSPDEFSYFKKVTRRSGQRSILRNVMESNK